MFAFQPVPAKNLTEQNRETNGLSGRDGPTVNVIKRNQRFLSIRQATNGEPVEFSSSTSASGFPLQKTVSYSRNKKKLHTLAVVELLDAVACWTVVARSKMKKKSTPRQQVTPLPSWEGTESRSAPSSSTTTTTTTTKASLDTALTY